MNDDISDLDNDLAENGEDITLRYVTGTGSNVQNIEVKCRARVTAATTQQMIVANVLATDFNIVISPTQINEARWPGGQPPNPPPFNPDPRIPRPNGPYKVIARGTLKSVAWVDAKIASNSELVRINMRVSG